VNPLFIPPAYEKPTPKPRVKPASRKPLVFLDQPEKCRKCKQWCWTRKVGGKIPLHPSCDTRPEMLSDDPVIAVEALTTVARIFGPLAIATPPPPLPSEFGPCARCQHQCRRYGVWGDVFCPDCRKENR